ncbi:hypothetical protein [Nocardiopsis sp. LOL_012]|uniref:hypothetical protein n=1 Tax=Nocardiopsis sp. LOL_012 TaxID=3345409 RepID=UPI003A877012
MLQRIDTTKYYAGAKTELVVFPYAQMGDVEFVYKSEWKYPRKYGPHVWIEATSSGWTKKLIMAEWGADSYRRMTDLLRNISAFVGRGS